MAAICPDCAAGKCPVCTGEAFDDELDEVVRCEHDCRTPTEDDVPLFSGFIPVLIEDERLSDQQRRTLRQQAHVSAGVHPLTGGRLHPEASRARTRNSGSKDPYTCGTCVLRQFPGRASNRSFPKCQQRDGKYDTHSAASDVKSWWPACEQYDPEPGSIGGVSPLTSVGGE